MRDAVWQEMIGTASSIWADQPIGRRPLTLSAMKRFFLAGAGEPTTNEVFFETGGLVVHHQHCQTSGNPVRIGDGCATVTGYKLPEPLVSSETGKAGVRFQARSQDIGLAVLVVAPIAGQAESLSWLGANFSVKEKDEASPSCECAGGFAECLHSPFCRGLKACCFLALRWSLNH
jgi:hypothetical protein